MRTNLKVPFAEKDEAKKLGAKWDATLKLWYVPGDKDLTPFQRWSPSPHDEGAAPAAAKSAPVAQQKTVGKVYVGKDYLEVARVCQCLPWEVCAQCAATALTGD